MASYSGTLASCSSAYAMLHCDDASYIVRRRRGLHLVPVGLHVDDAFTGLMLAKDGSCMPQSVASCLKAHRLVGRVGHEVAARSDAPQSAGGRGQCVIGGANKAPRGFLLHMNITITRQALK
jgi:hypothetical protein